MSTVFFVRLKKKQVVTSRPVLGDVFLFKHTQYSVSFRWGRGQILTPWQIRKKKAQCGTRSRYYLQSWPLVTHFR